MATGQPAIAVRGLRVRRGGREVLRDLEFGVRRGAVTGLVGPSGCGKTTLMRAIVGLQRIASGSVTVLGAPAGTPSLRRRIGYVTQAPAVYPDLTVAENLRFFASVVGTPAADVPRVIDEVRLGPLAGQVVRDLSGGEQARVSLATALLGRPDLLVLDEPTVGLDPVLRRDLWDGFGALAARGTTLLISSHVMDEASRCSELLLLREGRLLAAGSPEALLERTASGDLEAAFLALVEEAEEVTA
jgi:ABC-2 type transport system ATP-binding protein